MTDRTDPSDRLRSLIPLYIDPARIWNRPDLLLDWVLGGNNMKNQDPILVFVADLFFRAKIEATGKSTGSSVRILDSREALIQECRGQREKIVVLDLTNDVSRPFELIQTLKRDCDTITLIGFYSHVDKDLERRASEAGCDLVLPKSTFSKRLPEILTGTLSVG